MPGDFHLERAARQIVQADNAMTPTNESLGEGDPTNPATPVIPKTGESFIKASRRMRVEFAKASACRLENNA